MIITKVHYTVKQEYAVHNKENIARVMSELRQVDHPGVRYSAFLDEDGKTFVHLVICADEEAKRFLGSLESFKSFQAALKASEPETPPVITNLNFESSSYNYF